MQRRLDRDPGLRERMRDLAAYQARRLADSYRDLQKTLKETYDGDR